MNRAKWTIAQIRADNKAAGLHFFERGTMRFFASCVEPYVYEGPGGVYFVTSEQFTGSNGYSALRKWTVRRFDHSTGECETVGPFNQYTKREARLKAKDLAR